MIDFLKRLPPDLSGPLAASLLLAALVMIFLH